MSRLQNKTALITGGVSGIGAETAKLFIQEGAQVIITDLCDELGAQLVKNLGNQAHYIHLDVQFEEQWEDVTHWIQAKFGYLDILFNNAGIMGFNEGLGNQNPEHTSLKTWKAIHSINLDGVFLGCRAGIPLMKSRGGSIINMSSRSGIVGIPTACAYASSKAAVRNHTKTVALYCAQNGYRIRCNSLHPAAILTPLWDFALCGESPEHRQSQMEEITEGIPLGHMGEPLDVAYAALYLASDESKFVTGTELVIDGGILAGSSAAPHQSTH
jgi:3(or 17)beta-hydroxysteroid dehydrogenase